MWFSFLSSDSDTHHSSAFFRQFLSSQRNLAKEEKLKLNKSDQLTGHTIPDRAVRIRPVTKMESAHHRLPSWSAKRLPTIDQDGASPVSRPHILRQGAARGTRSAQNKEIVSAFEWDALRIERARDPADLVAATSPGSSNNLVLPPSHRLVQRDVAVTALTPLRIMSRNRPRGPPVPRDNGLAANEETDMWNKILQDLRKAKEKNDKQKSLAEQISALNEKIGREGGSKCRISLSLVSFRFVFLFSRSWRRKRI